MALLQCNMTEVFLLASLTVREHEGVCSPTGGFMYYDETFSTGLSMVLCTMVILQKATQQGMDGGS